MVATGSGAVARCQHSSVSERTTCRLVGAVVFAAALAGCSLSSPSPASTPPSGAASTAVADPAQVYLDAVNALCDALLPKIVAVTHGGSIDVPARDYLATWPAHRRLLHGFDAHVATIPVPAAAERKAAALTAYVHFADRFDTARLVAAQKGQVAYANEVQSESGIGDDPAIAALAAASFNDSCTAR
jgi:hypothetical protein